MRKNPLEDLRIDIPAVVRTEEGQLRGGFIMMEPSGSPADGLNDDCSYNDTCSGNHSCKHNGTCIKNGTCNNNTVCPKPVDPPVVNPNTSC